jgi:hypothetical protein
MKHNKFQYPAVRNIVDRFPAGLPNLAVIGSDCDKSAIFGEILRSGSWGRFVKEGFGAVIAESRDAQIFPIIGPAKTASAEMASQQLKILEAIGIDGLPAAPYNSILSRISSALVSPPLHWGGWVENLIASQFGIHDGGLPALNDLLGKKSARVLMVLDGLEDIFQNPEDEQSRDAIKGFIRLIDRIEEISSPRIGLILFVSEAYARAAIRQNFGQWMQRWR